MDGKREITYALRRWVYRGKCTVVQKLNGKDVNEYDGYDYGTYFVLVPRRRIIPSEVPIERHEVNIRFIRREF
jgi:hypothetical protein